MMGPSKFTVRLAFSLIGLLGVALFPATRAQASQTSLAVLSALSTLELRHPLPAVPEPRGFQSNYGRLNAERTGLNRNRMFAWGGLAAGAGYLAYEQSQASWGLSNGKFHFKDDLRDGLALSDEASHLFAAYHLTRALHVGYDWTGLSSTRARRLAAAHAWVWTFLVEYPIDALNPTQGFGVSDVAFNTVGVIAAYQQTRPGATPWWDIKISVKESFFQGENRLIAHSNEHYGDYIYWLTVRPSQNRYAPLWLGAGYSTRHGEWPHLDKELHLAVGTTIGDLAGAVDQNLGKYLRPLNFFYFNIGTKVVWK